ncbi:MAG: OmpA family protein [Haliangiales bacterium]
MARLHALWMSAALVALATTGCGVKKETHQKCLDELTTTQSRLSDTEQDRDAKANEVARLESQINELKAERDAISAAEREQQQRIAEMQTDMNATRQELTDLRTQRDKAEQRLKAFRELYDRFQSLVDTGKMQVEFRNGQMVLKLPSEVLFASGRAKLSKPGEAALTEVFDILVDFRDRRFLVAGHTDDVKIRSRRFRNNWYLSTARAVSVVEFMVEAGFSAHNLGAAGYGEFDPVAPNDTPENRQRNRRIEIIIVPDLSELPNLRVQPTS